MDVERVGKTALVNLITISRYALSILTLYELGRGEVVSSIGLVGLGWLTDIVDGKLARRWAVETKLGAINDALADGFFYGSAFATLASCFDRSSYKMVFGVMYIIYTTGRLAMEIK